MMCIVRTQLIGRYEMNEFKVGDTVKRISGPEQVMSVGALHKVQSIGKHNIYLEGHQGPVMTFNFELVQSKYPNPPHKHADVIIEWAKGANIQHEDVTGRWFDCIGTPKFYAANNYRVALTPSELADIKTRAKIDKLKAKIDKLELTLGDK